MTMLIDVALLKELEDGLAHDQPPDILWHYTSIAGAKAILESRSVNLACHAFMNDPAEGTAAGTIVSECWMSVVDGCPAHPRLDNSYIRDATEALSYFDFNRPELPPTFLFSLTELRDSLSQWSRYGDNGAGIALGFGVRSADLPPKSNRPWNTGTDVIHVRYDCAETNGTSNSLRQLVTALLTKYFATFDSPTEVENTLIALIHRLNPMVKSGAYSEEREWRIITRTVAESVELYEIGCNRFGIVPHVPLSFDHGLELVEVMLGPKLSRENAWSAKWLCKKFGHEPKISLSGLGYR